MERENVVLNKSIDFAIRIVKLSRFLREQHNEFVLSKQILRSGTSIGANLSEAECAISKDDKSYRSMHRDCKAIVKILSATTKTVEKNITTEAQQQKQKKKK